MNTRHTPTRHGDWHLIDGQLVDLSQNAEPQDRELPPKAVTGSDVDGESLLSGPAKHAGRSEAARASGSQAPPPHPSLPPVSTAPNKRRNKSTSED